MPPHILVIDDSEQLLDLFTAIFEDEGYDVSVSLVTFDNLDAIDQISPDLIVLDQVFSQRPRGWQMLEELKLRPSTEHIPVIMCTGAQVTAERMEPYFIQHDVAVVLKPFDVEDLLDAVRQALETDTPTRRVIIAPLAHV